MAIKGSLAVNRVSTATKTLIRNNRAVSLAVNRASTALKTLTLSRGSLATRERSRKNIVTAIADKRRREGTSGLLIFQRSEKWSDPFGGEQDGSHKGVTLKGYVRFGASAVSQQERSLQEVDGGCIRKLVGKIDSSITLGECDAYSSCW
jgi:hypothetical protein